MLMNCTKSGLDFVYGLCFCLGIWIILASQCELECVPSPLSLLPRDSLPLLFFEDFWRTGIDSFTDIWFTLWTALKWLKWVFYSFVIHLVRYSVSSWVISIVCVFIGVYIIEVTYLLAKLFIEFLICFISQRSVVISLFIPELVLYLLLPFCFPSD